MPLDIASAKEISDEEELEFLVLEIERLRTLVADIDPACEYFLSMAERALVEKREDAHKTTLS